MRHGPKEVNDWLLFAVFGFSGAGFAGFGLGASALEEKSS